MARSYSEPVRRTNPWERAMPAMFFVATPHAIGGNRRFTGVFFTMAVLVSANPFR